MTTGRLKCLSWGQSLFALCLISFSVSCEGSRRDWHSHFPRFFRPIAICLSRETLRWVECQTHWHCTDDCSRIRRLSLSFSKAQKFPKFSRTVITEAILRHPHSHFSLCLTFSHWHVSKPARFPRTVIDGKKEKSRRKLTAGQMTEDNSCFIRKCGPNHKEDVERVSASQPGEELISWNDGIEMVVNIKAEAGFQQTFSNQKCHF